MGLWISSDTFLLVWVVYFQPVVLEINLAIVFLQVGFPNIQILIFGNTSSQEYSYGFQQ